MMESRIFLIADVFTMFLNKDDDFPLIVVLI